MENNTAEISVSTTQRVTDDLRERIIQGKFTPGEKLKIESLKDLLNSGASPIREALSLLTSDQLVERIDQRGFRVAPASASQFKEILSLRCQFDDIALRKSVASGNIEWEEQLVLAHHRLLQSDRNLTVQHESLHKAFHTALLNGCGSPILLRFSDQLYDLNIRYRYLAGKSAQYQNRNIEKEHQDILQAVIERDEELASQRLREHYQLTGKFLADQFE